MSDIHPDRECNKTCAICDKNLGSRRRMHIPQDHKDRMMWAIKEFKVPQDSCICANCALKIKLGYQEPSTLYEPNKEDESAASEEGENETDQDQEEFVEPKPSGQRISNTNSVPNNSCFLARYDICEESAMWNVAAPDWGSFAATFNLEHKREIELPHNFSLCHPHYCKHTSFRIPKCALCHKKCTILRTNGQLYMKAFKLTSAMEKYCRSNKVRMLITDATRLCTRCHQKMVQQMSNPRKAILPRVAGSTPKKITTNNSASSDEIQIISIKRKPTTPNNNATTKVMKTGTNPKLSTLVKPSNTKLDVLLVCEDEGLTPKQMEPYKKYGEMQKKHSVETINYYKTHSVR